MFMMNKFRGLYFQANAGGGGAGTEDSGSGAGGDAQPELTYESWFEKQDDKVKGLLNGHTQNLKSALDTERGTRKDLEKQVRDLASKAEKGSEAEKQLTSLADNLAKSDRRADFYDAAHKAGVTNLKLAYITAESEDLFDKKGNVNFDDFKAKFPELFGAKKSVKGSAGDGTEQVDEPVSMNERIRRAAGRK